MTPNNKEGRETCATGKPYQAPLTAPIALSPTCVLTGSETTFKVDTNDDSGGESPSTGRGKEYEMDFVAQWENGLE